MEAPSIDPLVAKFIIDSQASDMFAMITDYKRRGEKTSYVAVAVNTPEFKAAYLFRPAKEVLAKGGLPQSFRDQVKNFNILGFIQEGEGQASIDLLAGLNKPFGAVRSVAEVRRGLHPGSVLTFTNHFLRLRGLEKDISGYTYEEFTQAVQSRTEVLKTLKNSLG
ncbi:MAG: hypothetical protein KKE73_01140 [Proteobacteria bacterium]|nr:hypothetical protein [Pseudomonadota bacterium]